MTDAPGETETVQTNHRLSEITLDHCELVMANLPETASAGTRRQVAQLIRKVLAHLDKVGVGAPHVPAAPRSAASIVRAPGLTAQDGRESIDVPPGQRRPGLPRHR